MRINVLLVTFPSIKPKITVHFDIANDYWTSQSRKKRSLQHLLVTTGSSSATVLFKCQNIRRFTVTCIVFIYVFIYISKMYSVHTEQSLWIRIVVAFQTLCLNIHSKHCFPQYCSAWPLNSERSSAFVSFFFFYLQCVCVFCVCVLHNIL